MERKNAWKKYSDEDRTMYSHLQMNIRLLYLSVRQKENV